MCSRHARTLFHELEFNGMKPLQPALEGQWQFRYVYEFEKRDYGKDQARVENALNAFQECQSTWSRDCYDDKRSVWIEDVYRTSFPYSVEMMEDRLRIVNDKIKSCWIGCDYAKVERYILLKRLSLLLEDRANYAFELRTECVTELCAKTMTQVISGGLFPRLRNVEVSRLVALDTPSVNELDPLWSVIGVALCSVTLLAVFVVIAFALWNGVHKSSLITLVLLGFLIVTSALSLSYYAIFYGGSGSVAEGKWKFLLVPDFIVYPLFSLVVMIFLYQYVMATRGSPLIVTIVFAALVVAVVVGGIVGIVYTLRSLDVLLVPRITYASFALAMSLALLGYAGFIFRKYKLSDARSKSTELMMIIMLAVVSVFTLSYAIQVAFEAMKFPSQSIRPPLWASTFFSKTIPELFVSFALLFVITSGIVVGSKTKKYVETEEPLLKSSEELEMSETQENEANIPKRYDM